MKFSGLWHLDVSVSSAAPAWAKDGSSARNHLILPVGTPMTIGRPSKAANQADLVIEGDPSLSKVHVSVVREGDGLVISELSRFGSWVDGVKMQENLSLPLTQGSVIKLAGKVWIRVGFTPILPLMTSHVSNEEVRSVLATIGIHLAQVWTEGITHLVHTSSSTPSIKGTVDVLRALHSRIPMVNESWLIELQSLSENKTSSSLPATSAHSLSHVSLAEPGRPTIPVSTLGPPQPTLLSSLNILFVNGYSDQGIKWGVRACGGRIALHLPPSNPPLHFDSSLLAVSSAMAFSYMHPLGKKSMAHMPAVELLSCLLIGDGASITQRVLNAKMSFKADERRRASAAAAANAEAIDDTTDEEIDVVSPMRCQGDQRDEVMVDVSPSLSNAILPGSPLSHSGVPLSAERPSRPLQPLQPLQQGSGLKRLRAGAGRGDDDGYGGFGPPPKVTMSAWDEIDKHRLRSFSTTHQLPDATGVPEEGVKGKDARAGAGAGKTRPPPPRPPPFDAPPMPKDPPPPPQGTETVGPGHFILYMPLQVLPFDRPRNEEDAAGGNLGEEAGVPPINYKKFRKGSAGEASLEKRILPLVVVEGRVPRNEGGDAVLRAEMKRMENKRKADALFRDDERGGKVTEKRRKK